MASFDTSTSTGGGARKNVSPVVEKPLAIKTVKHTFKEVKATFETGDTYTKSWQSGWEPDATGNWVSKDLKGDYHWHHVGYLHTEHPVTNNEHYSWSSANPEGTVTIDGNYYGPIAALKAINTDFLL